MPSPQIYTSPYPPLDTKTLDANILSHLFRSTSPSALSDKPLWINADNPSQSLSKAQAFSLIRRIGAGLDRLSLPKGSVVFVHSPNHIYIPPVYLGIVGSGRIFSGASPGASSAELAHQLRDTDAALILSHPGVAKVAIQAVQSLGWNTDKVISFAAGDPKQAAGLASGLGLADWREVLLASEEQGASWTWDPMLGDGVAGKIIATINYSSGTTGLPKGVCVSHRSLVANAEQIIVTRDSMQDYQPGNGPDERWIGFLPIYHAFGQIYTCSLVARLDIPIYIMSNFILTDFLRHVQTFKITHLQLVPPILVMLTKRPEPSQYDLSSLKQMVCGAAPLAKTLQNEAMRRFDVNITQGWGMTEVTCGGLGVPGGAQDLSGSVGPPVASAECRLVDEHGNDVAAGQAGELLIRGPNVCLGYWRNEQATKDLFTADGFLRTGDVAIVKDGWFTIVDRRKELIKVNALQVAPAELESILLENDSVSDAAVVGITLHGEEWPRAYIALKDDKKGKTKDSEIAAWLASRVAKHKRLVGGIGFVDAVPRLPSGKIQRKVVREWAKRDAKDMEERVRSRL